MYAVIALQGHQYIVKKGDLLTVDKIESDDKKNKLTIKDVLAVYDESGENVKVGTPHVAKASVLAEIQEQKRGEKVITAKFKVKNRYYRKRGFKAHQSVLKINDIVLDV